MDQQLLTAKCACLLFVAFVVGMTTALGMLEGTRSTLFALALVMTLVVAYDATGVRLHAGQHASVLNLIIAELPRDHPASETVALKETLGHTPVQVWDIVKLRA